MASAEAKAAVLCGEGQRAPLSHTSALRARVIARVIAQLDRCIGAAGNTSKKHSDGLPAQTRRRRRAQRGQRVI